MTTTSGLPTLTGANLLATDLTGVSRAGAANYGMTITEFVRGLAPKMHNDRGNVNPFSIYNASDIVLFKTGARVLFKQTCQADVNGFISSTGANGQPNFVVMNLYQMVPAALYGISPNNSAATNSLNFATAFGVANATNANATGRMLELPGGVIAVGKSVADGSAAIHVPNGCGMYGQGRIATYLQLADGANCSVVRLHTSSGAGNANAFFCKLADFGIDGRWTTQGTRFTDATYTIGLNTMSSTLHTFGANGSYLVGPGIPANTTITSGGGTTSVVMSAVAQATFVAGSDVTDVPAACYGILCRTNPLTAQQSGDWGFDPTHLLDNLYLKNCLHTAIRIEGRGGSTVRDVLIEQCQEEGINTSFDMHFTNVNIAFTGWAGLALNGSSQSLSGVKVYNTGISTRATGIINFAEGMVVDGRAAVIGQISVQQVSGTCVRVKNSKGINLQIDASSWGYQAAGAVALPGAFALELDNVKASTFTVTGLAERSDTTATPTTGRGYRLINGTDTCTINYSHVLAGTSGTLAPAESADTTRLANKITVNGSTINAPGDALSRSWYYIRRTTTTPSFVLPFAANVVAAGMTPTASLMYVYRYLLPTTGMKIYAGSVRPLALATSAVVARIGVYLNQDASRNDVPGILGELTTLESNTPLDMTSGGGAANAVRQTTTLASPLVVTGDEFWGAVVFQGTISPMTCQALTGGSLARGTNLPIPGIAYQATNNTTGALPASFFTANMTAPPVTFDTAPALAFAVLD